MKLFIQHKTQFFIFFVSFALLFHAFIRGYNPQDEGWVLYGAWRIFEGGVPYRDFQYLYTPLSAFLGSLSFVFDISIFSERMLALTLSSLTATVLYSFLNQLKFSHVTSILITAFFLVWGPLHSNFLSPTILSVEVGIVYLYVLNRIISGKTKSHTSLFIAGSLVSLVLLTKQNFGAGVLVHSVVVFTMVKMRFSITKSIVFVIGIVTPIIIFVFYLLMTNSFQYFMREMYDFLVLDAILNDGFKYHTPFTFPAPLFYKLAKIALYFSPLLLGIWTFLVCIKKRSHYFYIPLLLILFFYVGIQPVMDTVHLTPIIAFSSICIGIFLKCSNSRTQKVITHLIFFLLILGIYSGIFRNYFKWFAPLYTNTGQIESKHAKILIEPNDALAINSIVSYITQHSNSDESIFNYGMTPIFYFLSARQSPSKFNTIETRNVQGENLEILLQELESNPPHLIISDGEFRNINPRVELFILENYERTATVGGRTFYKPI